ncbi:hypothetical protein [Cupriavidus metallidurans]|uniref:hypothetical protein n=1 Tax=Cupriavidus metallidurans TaxID=119219 RepID=UPI000788EBFC|nr:hypothetical protein [Cupriavidus metallidurans]AVA36606.1 hypothetical protein C3Z06_25315 [Cupriavidus metallidurans]
MKRGAIAVALAALVGGFAWSPMASAAGSGVVRGMSCDPNGVPDSSCLGMPAAQRAAGGLVRRDDPVSGAPSGCTQGAADSSCASRVGSYGAPYKQPSSAAAAMACANYAANVWQGACPAGYQGAITYRQDYSCPMRSIASIGGLLRAPAEPGEWSPAYQVASSCELIQPPSPPLCAANGGGPGQDPNHWLMVYLNIPADTSINRTVTYGFQYDSAPQSGLLVDVPWGGSWPTPSSVGSGAVFNSLQSALNSRGFRTGPSSYAIVNYDPNDYSAPVPNPIGSGGIFTMLIVGMFPICPN